MTCDCCTAPLLSAAPTNHGDCCAISHTEKLAARTRALSWFSLAVIGTEAAGALLAGLIAGSVALIAFAADSGVEALASLIIIWRFSSSRVHSHQAEERANRLVGYTWFALAPYIFVYASYSLLVQQHPAVSVLGMMTMAFSLTMMSLLSAYKSHLGRQLKSGAVLGEANQGWMCTALAAAVLIGLLINALWGLWWLDSTIAIALSLLCVREGIRARRGQYCCH